MMAVSSSAAGRWRTASAAGWGAWSSYRREAATCRTVPDHRTRERDGPASVRSNRRSCLATAEATIVRPAAWCTACCGPSAAAGDARGGAGWCSRSAVASCTRA